MNNRSALNISNVIRLAEVATNTEDAEREKHIAAMCTHLDDAYRLQMNYRKTASPWERVYKFGFFDGSFVRNMYIITKLLFVINVIGQFYMMNFFLGQNSSTWGIKLLSDLTNGKDWDDSGNFPRVTMCDFDVRILGNIQRYTIQVLNMFNEKIFLFLYWWFLVVGFMTAVEGCFWIFETQMTTSRIVYAKKHVQVERNEEHLFQQFCDVKLNADGILILRLISSHTNDLIVKDVLKILWELYKSKASLESVAIVSTLHEYPETVKNSYMILDSSPPGERYFRRDELSTPLIEDRKRNSKCD
uniref:Innexin n=1 Tax=Rhabditophanes sp. KR3021 TaxID=114890 RepID=A0AC35UBY9_9BILA